MKIYRISATQYHVVKEELGDRTRYYLADEKGNTLNNEGEPIGKLVVQRNIDPNNYMITGFKIDDPEQRGQKLGSLLMREFLNDTKWMDKNVMVNPAPYSDDNWDEDVQYLRAVYGHFGFEQYLGDWMVLRQRIKSDNKK